MAVATGLKMAGLMTVMRTPLSIMPDIVCERPMYLCGWNVTPGSLFAIHAQGEICPEPIVGHQRPFAFQQDGLPFELLQHRLSFRVKSQILFNALPGFLVQCTVDIRRKVFVKMFFYSAFHNGSSFFLNNERPLESLDFTVPISQCRTSAISSYDIPSISFKIIGSLNFSGTDRSPMETNSRAELSAGASENSSGNISSAFSVMECSEKIFRSLRDRISSLQRLTAMRYTQV